MNIENPWKLIKAGFWLGIGFIVPTVIVYILSMVIIYGGMWSFWQSIAEPSLDSSESVDGMTFNFDESGQVAIKEYKDISKHGRLLIVGIVENTGTESADSIRVEAELFDRNGEFTYECSEYLQRKLNPGDKENFQIKCGCGDSAIPEYKTITVRVVDAGSF